MACIFTTKSSRICGDLLSSEDLTNRVCSGPLWPATREAVDQARYEDQDHNHHKHDGTDQRRRRRNILPDFRQRMWIARAEIDGASMAVFTHSVTHTPSAR